MFEVAREGSWPEFRVDKADGKMLVHRHAFLKLMLPSRNSTEHISAFKHTGANVDSHSRTKEEFVSVHGEDKTWNSLKVLAQEL